MTLYDFNLLSEREKDIALKEAVMLADREETNHTIYLYQLFSFYVEVHFHKGDPSLSFLRSFSSVDQLEPYLNSIKIDFIK
jgi:hypothetical protein